MNPQGYAQTLEVGDIDAILALLLQGQTRSLDVLEERQQFLSGLGAMLKADVWTFGFHHPGSAPATGFPLLTLHSPMKDQEIGSYQDALHMLIGERGASKNLPMGQPAPATIQRDSGPAEKWPVPMRSALVGIAPAPFSVHVVIALFRQTGSPSFTEYDHARMDLIFRHAMRKMETSPLYPPKGNGKPLSRKAKIVASLLIAGVCRKKIASHMNISMHTTQDYMKMIYRYFRVHSQMELINLMRPPSFLYGDYYHSAFPHCRT